MAGAITQGVIRQSDLVGPLAGTTLRDRVFEMLALNTYVDVHTNDGVPPTNSGPGDFPAGETRGQIRPRPAGN